MVCSVPERWGSVSLQNDIPSLQIVAADEELQAAVVHPSRLGERERLPDEARKPLAQGVDPTLDVGSLAFLLAGGLVPPFGDHPLVSLPEVAVAGRLLLAFGNLLP